jgi:hypothetical protein
MKVLETMNKAAKFVNKVVDLKSNNLKFNCSS